MYDTDICIFRSALRPPPAVRGEFAVSDDDVRGWVRNGHIISRLFRYRTGRLLTERLATGGRPMLAWVLRLMTRGRCVMVDLEGDRRELTLSLLLAWSWQLARETRQKPALLDRVTREVGDLERSGAADSPPAFDPTASPLYLRTDVSFGVRAGGSVGHIAGVVNELGHVLGPPIVVTTADLPTVQPDIEVHQLPASERFWNFREMPTFVMNDVFRTSVTGIVGRRPISLVYQRYSLNNYAGLALARAFRVPFVLEYNGSEIWMARHWGRPLLYESLALRIELLNLNAADLVVVVSRAMRDELVDRGVGPERILVNPNAVDPDRYAPGVSGAGVSARLGLTGKTTIGFVGTFQPWHGAGVLAMAFVALMAEHPEYRDSVRLLLIGSGPGLADVQRTILDARLEHAVVATGLVPQEEGAEHMAACEILVSPHVPNPDGSPFFGSPTKLFEYMAMGKAIVASDLEQLGEVLRQGETALLVPPGDVQALSASLARLIGDAPLRRALGDAARREAIAHHTWRAHVARTIDALAMRRHDAPGVQ